MSEVLDLLQGFHDKKARRSNWEHHWQDIADHMEPHSSFARSEVRGGLRGEKIFDTTAQQAKRGLAAALDGLIKPRSQRWFMVKPVDDDLAELDEVKRWTDNAADRMWNAIYESRARFIQASGETDNDLVTFGTGCLFVGENSSLNGFAFRAFDLKNFYLGVNSDGIVDQVDLVLWLTPRRAAERFGMENLGDKIQERLREGGKRANEGETEYVQRIFPREHFDPKMIGAENLPFASVTIDVESQHIIGKSGFHEFPCAIPRFDTAAGEIWGRSPAMLALADVKTNNQQGKTILRAGQLAADPPQVSVWDKAVSSQHRIPGGIVYASAEAWKVAGGAPIRPIQNGFNLPISREMQNDTREQIWNAFFRNVLNLPRDNPNMTATEVIERKEEFIRVIGPVFGRLEADYTAPVVERVFWVMARAGAFPPMPRALAERGGIRFDFRSPVTEARKQAEAQAGLQYAELMGPYAESPEAFGILDIEEMGRGVSEGVKMPAKWLKSREQVEQEQEAQAAALEQQAGQEQLLEGGQAVADILNKLPPEMAQTLEGGEGFNDDAEAEAAEVAASAF